MLFKSRMKTVAVDNRNDRPRVNRNRVGSRTISQTRESVGRLPTNGKTMARAARENIKFRKFEQTTDKGNAILRIVPPLETRLASPCEVASEKKFHIRTPLNM